MLRFETNNPYDKKIVSIFTFLKDQDKLNMMSKEIVYFNEENQIEGYGF
jgi:uncharacterized membrane protein